MASDLVDLALIHAFDAESMARFPVRKRIG